MLPRPILPTELEAIRAVQAEFGEYWASIRPPYPCAFAGSPDDLRAVDYLDYEVGLPPSGLWGAALIWGCVLEANGPLSLVR